MTRAIAIAACAAALTLGACALTAGTEAVTADYTATHPYHRIAVISMSQSKAERQLFDDVLVARLAAAGAGAVIGDRYIEDAAVANGIKPMDALRAARADGVMYVSMVPLGQDSRREAAGGTWGWGGAAATSWYPKQPDRNVIKAQFEFELYDIETQKLVWRGYSTQFYPKTLEQDAPHVADAIVVELVKRGVIH
jgi:hypothetical protein